MRSILWEYMIVHLGRIMRTHLRSIYDVTLGSKYDIHLRSIWCPNNSWSQLALLQLELVEVLHSLSTTNQTPKQSQYSSYSTVYFNCISQLLILIVCLNCISQVQISKDMSRSTLPPKTITLTHCYKMSTSISPPIDSIQLFLEIQRSESRRK